jgi:hypothetical protein
MHGECNVKCIQDVSLVAQNNTDDMNDTADMRVTDAYYAILAYDPLQLIRGQARRFIGRA